MERSSMERAMSTDLVMDIVLDHLKVRDLLSCRFVSKFWNKAASSVLRKRSTMIKKISTKKKLTELEKCMKRNSDFPFSGLSVAEPWKMTTVGEMNFFKNYGERFTSLALDTRSTTRLQGLAPFIHDLPRLSVLQLGYSSGRRLPHEFLDSADGPDDGRILNLPSLRTLRICSHGNEDVLRDIFTAVSSLLRIECHAYATREVLRALKETGKLQSVTFLRVLQDDKNVGMRVDDLLLSETPSLTKLDFGAGHSLSDNGLMKLLISSRDTLKYLSLYRIFQPQFSSESPVLPKLTTLSLHTAFKSCVFEGRHGYKFPALKELKLVETTAGLSSSLAAKWSDGLFTVPSLTKIDLDGNVDKTEIENLARSFPNVIEIVIGDRCNDCPVSWEENQGSIWSVRAFKFLEKLKIWNFPVTNGYYDINMDRFLTGMSSSICNNLREHAQQNLIGSPEILREYPSILQLENLKELVVCVKLEPGLEEISDNPPFISMVSLWYALDLMPNLEARFVYEHSSPSKRFQEKNRDSAVTTLKAAFKHVKPHVKLEPFFY